MNGYSKSKPASTFKSNWLAWTDNNFANMDDNQVAALIFVTRRKDIGIIFKPTPIKSEDGTFIGLLAICLTK